MSVVANFPDVEDPRYGLRLEIPEPDDSWPFWEQGIVRVILAEPDEDDVETVVEHLTDLNREEVEALRDTLTALLTGASL